MQACYPTTRVCGASAASFLWLSGLCVPPAQATSAGYRGPVELTVKQGVPCAHVALGSPNETLYGWALELRPGREGAVLWVRHVKDNRGPTPPTSEVSCLPLTGVSWRAGQPYRVEFSTYQLYRSDFCWQGSSPSNPVPRLLHVREDTGQCTDLPWVGGDGDALTTRGNWNRLILWWRGLFGR
jgi:hypothetical protein